MSYKIRNWSRYNAGLKQRGSLTFWLEESVIERWLLKNKSGKPGASPKYSDIAIATFETIKVVYGLPGRQAEGFLSSILNLMNLDLPVPEHSTVSKGIIFDWFLFMQQRLKMLKFAPGVTFASSSPKYLNIAYPSLGLT